MLAFKTTGQNGNATAMSRLPLPGPVCEPPIAAETVLLMEHLNMSPITAAQIRRCTSYDPVLSQVLKRVQEGRPEQCQENELRMWDMSYVNNLCKQWPPTHICTYPSISPTDSIVSELSLHEQIAYSLHSLTLLVV